jgi:hypothetical protein
MSAMGDSRQAFQALTNLDAESGRPALIYLTSSDEKWATKVETYENSVLYNEKVCIATKFFDCYQVDTADLEDDHPLHNLIKKPRPLTIHTVHKGKVICSTKEKPSSSNIFLVCDRTLKKAYSVSLEKIAREEEKILDELDKLRREKEKIDQTRLKKGKSLSKREDETLRKKEQKLFDREAVLREAEEKLLDLEQHKTARKKTAKY